MTGFVEEHVEKATGLVVRVIARERTPDGWTIFRWPDGRRGFRRHPVFAREFEPVQAEAEAK